jgi:hypothetical protein
MKRFLFVLFLIIGLPVIAYSATPPTVFTMSYPTGTYYPGVVIKVTMKVQAVYDSIIVTTAGDSLANSGYVATLDTTGVTWAAGSSNSWYITSMTPFTTYRWMVRVSKTGTKTFSNSDTLTTLPITFVADGVPDTQNNLMGVRMLRWDSWLPYSIRNTTITLTGASDTDSSCVYNPWKYTNLTIVASGHADSTKATMLIMAGYTGTDESKFRVTAVDSLNITAPGVYNTGTLTIPPSYGYYVKYRADADNGTVTPTTIKTWANKNRN